MKRCSACEKLFADKFSFCPLDSSPLNNFDAAVLVKQQSRTERNTKVANELQLTMLSSSSLLHRLTRELSFAIDQLRILWPEFKKNPAIVARRELHSLLNWLKVSFQPNAIFGLATGLLLVLSAGLCLMLVGPEPSEVPALAAQGEETVELVDMRLLAAILAAHEDKIGTGKKGRVGFNQGKGEGSETQQKRAHGGGSGGEQNLLKAGVGKTPVPSAVPAPISRPLTNASLPAAGIDLDPALWKNLSYISYGDPLVKATTTSKGPGEGGGIGEGHGQGIGIGRGNGVGLGIDGNMGGGPKAAGGDGDGGGWGGGIGGGMAANIYRTPDVTQRARVISKPEPQYTEAARKNQVTGSVVLSVVFSETGQITNIRAVKTLPDGLTEKAIAAARQIRFIPATRNGQPVSVYMQLEYNFNLY